MNEIEDKQRLSADELRKINAYWGAANYLSVGQIYLLDNPGCSGLSGLTNDMRELLDEARESDDRRAKLAIEIFCLSLT